MTDRLDIILQSDGIGRSIIQTTAEMAVAGKSLMKCAHTVTVFLQGSTPLDLKNAKQFVQFLQQKEDLWSVLKLKFSAPIAPEAVKLLNSFFKKATHLASVTFRRSTTSLTVNNQTTTTTRKKLKKPNQSNDPNQDNNCLDSGTMNLLSAGGLCQSPSCKHIAFAHVDWSGLLPQICLRSFLVKCANKQTHMLERLEFTYCDFGLGKTPSSSGLVQGLQAISSLKELLIMATSLTDTAAAAIVNAVNQSPSQLHKFQLLGDLQGQTKQALCQYLKNEQDRTNHLEELVLPREFFGEYNKSIMKAAQHTPSLARLITQTFLIPEAILSTSKHSTKSSPDELSFEDDIDDLDELLSTHKDQVAFLDKQEKIHRDSQRQLSIGTITTDDEDDDDEFGLI